MPHSKVCMFFRQRLKRAQSGTRLSMIVLLNMYAIGFIIVGVLKLIMETKNIRVVAKYYRRITLTRLTSLVGLGPAVIILLFFPNEFLIHSRQQETEAFLSNLVVNKTIFARMDRPAGIITFTKPQNPTVILNEWSNSIHSLLDLIVKTNHLITKEEMVHSLALDR